MATGDTFRTGSSKVSRTVLTLAAGLLIVVRAAQTGQTLLLAAGIALVLARLAIILTSNRRVRLGDGELEVRTAGVPRRLALSRLVSAELRGRRLALRSADGKAVTVPLTGTPTDAELVARLRAAAAPAGVSIPDPPTPGPWPSFGRVLGILVSVAVVIVLGVARTAGHASASPKPPPVTPELLASRDGTFLDPFTRIATCAAYVVPLDVDSITHADALALVLDPLVTGNTCVTHPLRVSPRVLDQRRRQLDSSRVANELHAAYRRAHATAPALVIGLTEFDLFSPAIPKDPYVTLYVRRSFGQTYAVASTAGGWRPDDYRAVARGIAG